MGLIYFNGQPMLPGDQSMHAILRLGCTAAEEIDRGAGTTLTWTCRGVLPPD